MAFEYEPKVIRHVLNPWAPAPKGTSGYSFYYALLQRRCWSRDKPDPKYVTGDLIAYVIKGA